jgi:hypothetical protein
MEGADRLDNYLAILEIRKKAYYRNVFIVGGMFFLAILATTGTLFLTDWNVRSLWLMGIFDVLFTVNFVMTWTRYEITRENIEMLKNLQIRG